MKRLPWSNDMDVLWTLSWVVLGMPVFLELLICFVSLDLNFPQGIRLKLLLIDSYNNSNNNHYMLSTLGAGSNQALNAFHSSDILSWKLLLIDPHGFYHKITDLSNDLWSSRPLSPLWICGRLSSSFNFIGLKRFISLNAFPCVKKYELGRNTHIIGCWLFPLKLKEKGRGYSVSNPKSGCLLIQARNLNTSFAPYKGSISSLVEWEKIILGHDVLPKRCFLLETNRR